MKVYKSGIMKDGGIEIGLGNIIPYMMTTEVALDIEWEIIRALAPLFDREPMGNDWRRFRLTFYAKDVGDRGASPNSLCARGLLFDDLKLEEEHNAET
jgi:hypothetical protein